VNIQQGFHARELYGAGLLFLENYAQEFARDMPPSTKLFLKLNQHKYNLAYSLTERANALKLLSNLLQADCCDGPMFILTFKVAVRELDS
jgi:hypothetical protein